MLLPKSAGDKASPTHPSRCCSTIIAKQSSAAVDVHIVLYICHSRCAPASKLLRNLAEDRCFHGLALVCPGYSSAVKLLGMRVNDRGTCWQPLDPRQRDREGGSVFSSRLRRGCRLSGSDHAATAGGYRRDTYKATLRRCFRECSLFRTRTRTVLILYRYDSVRKRTIQLTCRGATALLP